jgi:hypothetical protein
MRRAVVEPDDLSIELDRGAAAQDAHDDCGEDIDEAWIGAARIFEEP